MKKNGFSLFIIMTVALLMSLAVFEINADARVGGGRSVGSRGSRSYSQPASPYSQPSQTSPQYGTPYRPAPVQQPGGGGFLRSMAGGMVGGLLGGMLFRSLGFGGLGGGVGGSGIGLFEIILIAGICYMIYRMVKKRRESAPASPGSSFRDTYNQGGYQQEKVTPIFGAGQQLEPATGGVEAGLAHIRQMDPYFDENRFSDNVMDIFFKIQGAWMNRDLTPVAGLLTEEMKGILQEDADRLRREKRVNRLENIAVRSVDVVEAWQESGQDFITTQIYANLLDYTTDDTTGAVVAGSKTDPVKFEEYWTFTRPVGNNSWRLSAINQK